MTIEALGNQQAFRVTPLYARSDSAPSIVLAQVYIDQSATLFNVAIKFST